MHALVFSQYGKRELSGFGLRELKYAKCRFSLLQNLVQYLQEKPFSEIRVKDLCRAAEISEPSFYNYFPEKDDLLNYFVSLWSIELELHASGLRPGLLSLQDGFTHTARTSVLYPRLMKELLSYQARANVPERLLSLTPPGLAEKILAFGLSPSLEYVSSGGIRYWLQSQVKNATLNGDLPIKTNLKNAVMSYGAIFFGVAGLCSAENFQSLEEQYLSCMKIVTDGLFAKSKNKLT